jgi:hypothetical protein
MSHEGAARFGPRHQLTKRRMQFEDLPKNLNPAKSGVSYFLSRALRLFLFLN